MTPRQSYITDWRPTNDARREHIHGRLLPMDKDRSRRRHLNLRATMAVVAALIVAATGFGWVEIPEWVKAVLL